MKKTEWGKSRGKSLEKKKFRLATNLYLAVEEEKERKRKRTKKNKIKKYE